MDDLDRLLIRREGFALPRAPAPGLGAPAFLGKVTSTGSNIAAGKFLLVNPVEVTGAETEGGAGTFAVQSASVPVYLVGPTLPATNDYLICRRVDHRWVADTGRYIASGGGGPGVIPGCVCQGTPASLSLTVNYGSGESASDFANTLQPSTLSWLAAKPSYLDSGSLGGPGYYSDSTWVNDYGFTNAWRLTCRAGIYELGLYENSFGTWSGPGLMYRWNVGGTNTCSPFSLVAGTPYFYNATTGQLFKGTIVVTG